MNIDIKRKYITKSSETHFYVWLKLDHENKKVGTLRLPQTKNSELLSRKLNSFKSYHFNKSLKEYDQVIRKSLWYELLEKLNLPHIPTYFSQWKINNKERAKIYRRRWYYSHRNRILKEWRSTYPETMRGEYKPPSPDDKNFWKFMGKIFSKFNTPSK